MILADATPGANTVWIVVAALSSVLANIATIIYATASFRKNRTEVSFGFEPASKELFDDHVAKNDRDQLEVWREINELKKENLALTKSIGDMSSKILADLANAQRLRGH